MRGGRSPGTATLLLVSGSQTGSPLRHLGSRMRGVQKLALSAQGWWSPSGPLPTDENIRSGLSQHPPKCHRTLGLDGPAAHLLILGTPVEMGFFIHVQEQQVTDEGDLERQRTPMSCPSALFLPPPQPSPRDSISCTAREWGVPRCALGWAWTHSHCSQRKPTLPRLTTPSQAAPVPRVMVVGMSPNFPA